MLGSWSSAHEHEYLKIELQISYGRGSADDLDSIVRLFLEMIRYSGKVKEDRKRTRFESERRALINILNAVVRWLKLVEVRGSDLVIKFIEYE